MKNYDEYRPKIKTGDVIAFSGNSLVSKIIKWKTGSPYSHVGIVLDVNMGGAIGQSILFIESTILNNAADLKHLEFIKGVQMHFLSKRLESYDGSAWWLPLQEELLPHQTHNIQSWLRQIHNEKVKYDAIQALGAGMDFFDWFPGIENEKDFSSLFCSELVTKALQVAGLIDDNINASEQTPADVAGFDCFSDAVRL